MEPLFPPTAASQLSVPTACPPQTRPPQPDTAVPLPNSQFLLHVHHRLGHHSQILQYLFPTPSSYSMSTTDSATTARYCSISSQLPVPTACPPQTRPPQPDTAVPLPNSQFLLHVHHRLGHHSQILQYLFPTPSSYCMSTTDSATTARYCSTSSQLPVPTACPPQTRPPQPDTAVPLPNSQFLLHVHHRLGHHSQILQYLFPTPSSYCMSTTDSATTARYCSTSSQLPVPTACRPQTRPPQPDTAVPLPNSQFLLHVHHRLGHHSQILQYLFPTPSSYCMSTTDSATTARYCSTSAQLPVPTACPPHSRPPQPDTVVPLPNSQFLQHVDHRLGHHSQILQYLFIHEADERSVHETD